MYLYSLLMSSCNKRLPYQRSSISSLPEEEVLFVALKFVNKLFFRAVNERKGIFVQHWPSCLERKVLPCWKHIYGFRHLNKKIEKRLLTSSCLSSCPSVRMEQLVLHRTDLNEISYLSIFRTFFEKLQVSLKSDRNNWCFTWRRVYICDNHS
jgi:hypothetical protein